MSKESYAKRLKSPEWARFSKACRERVRHQCQMCGRQDGSSVVHHMRYHNMGTAKEWGDVVVVCPQCHDAYHSVHRLPPVGKKSRDGMLVEMSAVLMRRGIDVSHYLNHGDEMNEFWMRVPIIMDGVLPPPKCAKKALRDNWSPEGFEIQSQYAAAVLRNPSMNINGKVWRKRLGIPTPYPKKWKKKLLAYLRKTFPEIVSELKAEKSQPLRIA